MEAIYLGFVVWLDFVGFSRFRGGDLAGFCGSEVVWLCWWRFGWWFLANFDFWQSLWVVVLGLLVFVGWLWVVVLGWQWLWIVPLIGLWCFFFFFW